MALTREQILASKQDRKPVACDVPEWGGTIYVRVLSARDQMALSEMTKPAEMPIRILLHTIVDDEGRRILQDEDFEALAEESFPIIMRVFAFAAKLNGFSNKELESAVESFSQALDESSYSA
jgi:hypothetical protein